VSNTENVGSMLPAIDMSLDKNDVLAIVVSRGEAQLNEGVKQANAHARRHEEAAKQARAQLTKEGVAAALAAVQPGVEQIRAGFAAIGDGPAITTDTATTINAEAGTGQTTVTVTLKVRYDAIRVQHTLPFTPEQQAVVRQVAQDEQAAAAARAEAVAFRRQLANIPALERAMRARLAEAKLRTTAGGQQVLDVLTGDLQAQIAALPGF